MHAMAPGTTMLSARWPTPGAPHATPLAPWPRTPLLRPDWRPPRAFPVAYAFFRALHLPLARRPMVDAREAVLDAPARREPGADAQAGLRGAWGRCTERFERASGVLRLRRRPVACPDCFYKLFIKMPR